MSLVAPSRDTRGTLRPGVVIGALSLILLFALGVPYWAVSTLHARRLQRADRDLAALANALAQRRSLTPGEVLLGRGDRPRAADARWTTAPAAPMPDGSPADPWGNAYVALIAPDGTVSIVLSAGPDGALQTSATNPASPSGDDRGVLLHR